jgi:hypothetical protein
MKRNEYDPRHCFEEYWPLVRNTLAKEPHRNALVKGSSRFTCAWWVSEANGGIYVNPTKLRHCLLYAEWQRLLVRNPRYQYTVFQTYKDAWRRLQMVHCFDCDTHELSECTVHDSVWKEAMPDRSLAERELLRLFPSERHPLRRHRDPRSVVQLCFSCIEKRLNRKLTAEDFDLSIPVNLSLAKGIEIGRRSV